MDSSNCVTDGMAHSEQLDAEAEQSEQAQALHPETITLFVHGVGGTSEARLMRSAIQGFERSLSGGAIRMERRMANGNERLALIHSSGVHHLLLPLCWSGMRTRSDKGLSIVHALALGFLLLGALGGVIASPSKYVMQWIESHRLMSIVIICVLWVVIVLNGVAENVKNPVTNATEKLNQLIWLPSNAAMLVFIGLIMPFAGPFVPILAVFGLATWLLFEFIGSLNAANWKLRGLIIFFLVSLTPLFIGASLFLRESSLKVAAAITSAFESDVDPRFAGGEHMTFTGSGHKMRVLDTTELRTRTTESLLYGTSITDTKESTPDNLLDVTRPTGTIDDGTMITDTKKWTTDNLVDVLSPTGTLDYWAGTAETKERWMFTTRSRSFWGLSPDFLGVVLGSALVLVTIFPLCWRSSWLCDFIFDVLWYVRRRKNRVKLSTWLHNHLDGIQGEFPYARITVVGHSLGSVIVSHALCDASPRDSSQGVQIVTMGSPLDYLFRIFPRATVAPQVLYDVGVRSGPLARWLNLWREGDQIGKGLEINGPEFVQFSVGKGGHADYWSDREVWNVLADFVVGKNLRQESQVSSNGRSKELVVMGVLILLGEVFLFFGLWVCNCFLTSKY